MRPPWKADANLKGWEEKVYGDVTTLFPKGSRHVVLPGTRVLELGKHSVKVDKVHPGFGEVITFDQLIYATVSYPLEENFRRAELKGSPGFHLLLPLPAM
jgi:hypothetical protein